MPFVVAYNCAATAIMPIPIKASQRLLRIIQNSKRTKILSATTDHFRHSFLTRELSATFLECANYGKTRKRRRCAFVRRDRDGSWSGRSGLLNGDFGLYDVIRCVQDVRGDVSSVDRDLRRVRQSRSVYIENE